MKKLPKTAEREPESLPPPISKMLRVDELKDGEERSIEINRAERDTIATLLELVALDAQATRAERLALADDVVRNTGRVDELRAEIAQLHAKYVALAAAR